MNILFPATVSALSVAYMGWLCLIARHHAPLTLFFSYHAVLLITIWPLWKKVVYGGQAAAVAFSVGIGLTASLVALALMTFHLYGGGEFHSRFFSSALSVYSLLLLGWLHVPLLTLLIRRHRQRKLNATLSH